MHGDLTVSLSNWESEMLRLKFATILAAVAFAIANGMARTPKHNWF